jgi:hypothetical protein
MPGASPTSLADHRARRLVERLLELQAGLEQAEGPDAAARVAETFDALEGVLAELERTAPMVREAKLRAAIARACEAHRGFWAAVATSGERAAVGRYLRSVEALARAAGAARS